MELCGEIEAGGRVMTYTIGTLFSGIGVPDLAARLLGMTTVFQVEKDVYCQQVLRKNFPEAQLYGDIFDVRDLPQVDVMVAGFPCQPFSLAGKRLGERDERYLVPEMFRVIEEVKPRVVLFENVTGFTSIAAGRTFRDFLRALAGMGYDAEWGVVSASDFGAPHQRERWWCVAHTNRLGRPAARQLQAPAIHDTEWQCTPSQPRRVELVYDAERSRAGDRAAARRAQRRLGRGVNGPPDWVDSAGRWPARPYERPHAWEPPRLVVGTGQTNADRLYALGNSMAFPVAYAILANIQLWLQSQDQAAQDQAA